MQSVTGPENYPEVDITIDGNWLGEGITGIKGVMKSMDINSEGEGADEHNTCVRLEVILTSVKLGEGVSENVAAAAEKIAEKVGVGRYIDF